MKKILSRIIPILVMGSLAAGAIYYLNTITNEDQGPLKASGTVETVQVALAPELGGRVVAVFAEEGQAVAEGEILVQLDDSLLQAQLHQAESALAVAQANYDLVAAGMPSEQQQAAVSGASFELLAAQQARAVLEDHVDLAAAQALQAVARAENLVDDAQRRVDTLNQASDPADVDAAYATMILAQDRLQTAQEDFDSWKNKPETNVTRALFQSKLALAQQIYDDAVRRYNNLIGTVNTLDLAQAEADLELAKTQLAEAQKDYEILKAGPDPDDVALAEARIANAEAQLALAKMESPTAEQLGVAQSQVDSARTNLDAIQVQIAKMTIKAPMDGVVLTRIVEPGEIALPNAPLLTLARLDDLTITIYIPEDRYGTIQLGQTLEVWTDSFPGKPFPAVVTFIADKAEFTPRNVQTEEGRRTTVFAIKLSVDNQNGQLKPGMPVDVYLDD